jgi:hypothetical protein
MRKNDTPLVLAAYQSATDKYLVVVSTGICGTGQASPNVDGLAGHDPTERFWQVFERVKEHMKLHMTHDGFDASVAEVDSGRLKEFLHLLRTATPRGTES